jgi:hypothetical protein
MDFPIYNFVVLAFFLVSMDSTVYSSVVLVFFLGCAAFLLAFIDFSVYSSVDLYRLLLVFNRIHSVGSKLLWINIYSPFQGQKSISLSFSQNAEISIFPYYGFSYDSVSILPPSR